MGSFLTVLPRVVFRTQSKVYVGAFLQKQLTTFSRKHFFAKKAHHKCQTMLPVKKKEILTYFYFVILHTFCIFHNLIWFCKLFSFCRHQTNFALQSSNRVNIMREMCIFYALFLIFVLHFFAAQRFLVVVLEGYFSFGRQKQMAACHVRQVAVLYSNDCTRICLGGLRIGRLTEVVI